MWTKTAPSFVAVTVLVMSGLCGKPARAALPSDPIPAQVRFANAPGDRILSDAYGDTYRDGELGVACAFHIGTGDLILRTTTNGPPQNSPRKLSFQFGTPLNTGCPISPGGSILASEQGGHMNVRSIYGLAVGSTTTARVVFHLSEGALWFGRPDSLCATPVQVTRQDASTWIITAVPGVNDVAVFMQNIKRDFVATNHWGMPFSITATLLQ